MGNAEYMGSRTMTKAVYFFFFLFSASVSASERFHGEKRNWAFADLMTPDGSFDFDSKRSYEPSFRMRKRNTGTPIDLRGYFTADHNPQDFSKNMDYDDLKGLLSDALERFILPFKQHAAGVQSAADV